MNSRGHTLWVLWALLLGAGPVLAQASAVTSPESVGLSSSRLGRIEGVMQQYIEEQKIAGAVTFVMRRGKGVHCASFGMMDIAAQKPMTTDAMFRIASMSKAITSTAVMQLYEEGRFLLSDPVSKYLPEFAHPKVLVPSADGTSFTQEPARQEIAIRHLLNHTAGITYGDGPLAKFYKDAGVTSGLGPTEGTIAEMVARLAPLPLISHPGEEFHYGLSIDVLGRLVEVVSGLSFEQFLQERLLGPLGMNDTHFTVPKAKLSRLAKTYGRTRDGQLRCDSPDLGYLAAQTYFSGGAALVSTASDYARFAQMILNGGQLAGVRILSPKTVELMTTNSIGELYSAFRINSGDKFGYGFGIRTERGQYDELESLGIIGWDGAYYTRFWIDPKEELIGIFMSQSSDGWSMDLVNKYRVLVYQSIIETANPRR